MSYLNKIRPLFVDGERSPLCNLKDIATIEKIDGVKFFLPPGVKSRVFKQTRSDMEWLQTELGLVFEINHEQMLRKHEPLFKEKTLSSISLLISDLVKKPIRMAQAEGSDSRIIEGVIRATPARLI